MLHSLVDVYTKDILRIRWDHFRQTHDMITHLTKDTRLNIRRPNPPEDMTENMAKFIIQNKDNDPSCRWAKSIGTSGDLYSAKYTTDYPPEVKAFTSEGPCQFGPTKKFGVLYFLDLRTWTKDRVVLWRTNLRSDSAEIKKLRMTKTQTLEQQCIQGIRPRISWRKLYPQIAPHCVKVYEGTFDDIFIR